jgi:hypothetical protein
MINLKGCKSDYRRTSKGTFAEGSDRKLAITTALS